MSIEAIQKESRASQAQERHCTYYLELAKRHGRDWRKIEPVYGQIKRAFHAASDGEIRTAFLETLEFFLLRRNYLADCIDWCNTCLAWAKTVDREDKIAIIYRCLGETFIETQQYGNGIRALEKALPYAERIANETEIRRCLAGIGQIYGRQRRWEASIQALDRVLNDPYRNVVDDMTVKALCLRSDVFIARGQWRKAFSDLNRAYDIASDQDDFMGLYYVLRGLSVLSAMQGKWTEAEKHCLRCLDPARTIGDQTLEAFALYVLGIVCMEQGSFQRALDFFLQALRLRRELGQQGEVGYVLEQIGVCYHREGRLHDAHRVLIVALEIATDVDDRLVEAWAASNLAHVYRDLGRYAAAEESLRKASELFQGSKHMVGSSYSLMDPENVSIARLATYHCER